MHPPWVAHRRYFDSTGQDLHVRLLCSQSVVHCAQMWDSYVRIRFRMWFCRYLLFPIAYPISLALDYFVGRDIGTVYSQEELMRLIELHCTDPDAQVGLQFVLPLQFACISTAIGKHLVWIRIHAYGGWIFAEHLLNKATFCPWERICNVIFQS
jgi:hypothetical protein